MKKLIFKLSRLILLILVTVISFVLLAPKDKNSYYSAMDNKISRLEQLKSQKIILIGGSNLTFGIDSKRIEDEFYLPVVNMSLQAGLGFEFILNQMLNKAKKGVIAKGDIIIISPEYSYFSEYKGDAEPIYGYILNSKNINDFFLDTILYHCKYFGKSILYQYYQSIRNKPCGLYSSVNFNEFGDMIGHLDLPNEKFSHYKGKKYNISDFNFEGIEILSDFINDMNKVGIKVYITFPSISKTAYNNNREFNEKVANTLKLKFKNITISDYKKYVLNDELFFDTHYHLNNIGRNMRTDYLINDLHSVLVPTRH